MSRTPQHSNPHPDGQIRTQLIDQVFEIIIDRPAKMNGFTPKMIHELAEAYTLFDRAPEARCALLTASGRHFTAGLDLPKMQAAVAEGARLHPPGLIDPLMLRPPQRRKPVVVAVQGVCFTIGIELMLAADCVVAAEDCRFAQLEVGRGIMASGGATIRFVERAGWGNAMRYLLTGDEFDAATALRLGFVQEVVPTAYVRERALALAQSIAAQAPLAVQATLANAHLALIHGHDAAVNTFDAVWAELAKTEDVAEGLRSFIERRPGRFSGR